MFKGIFKSIIAAAAGMGIARVSSGFERNNGESLGHCVYGSEATGDFQKKLKIHRNKHCACDGLRIILKVSNYVSSTRVFLIR